MEVSDGCGHPSTGFGQNLRFFPTVMVGKAMRQRKAATRTMELFMVYEKNYDERINKWSTRLDRVII